MRYIVKSIEAEGRLVVARSWGWCGEIWGECLVGTELQSGKIKEFWRWRVVPIAQQCERV